MLEATTSGISHHKVLDGTRVVPVNLRNSCVFGDLSGTSVDISGVPRDLNELLLLVGSSVEYSKSCKGPTSS